MPDCDCHPSRSRWGEKDAGIFAASFLSATFCFAGTESRFGSSLTLTHGSSTVETRCIGHVLGSA